MLLVVTIPAYNEQADIATVIREAPRRIDGLSAVKVLVIDDGSTDETVKVAREAGADWVLSNPRNMGLAFTFQRAVQEALLQGADIIVNTDADNHYDQSAIPDLIEPILSGHADIVIGSRLLDGVDMPAAKRYGNRIGNALMQRVLDLPGVDVSTGFRAYSREAVLRTFVPSRHTYTHETLLSALDQRLTIANAPLATRTVARPSRLIKSVPHHVWHAGLIIAQSMLLYRPLQVYLLVALAVLLIGLVPLGRFLAEWAQGNGDGHIQSLVIGLTLVVVAGQISLLGLVAFAVRSNRWLLQEVLRNTKEQLLISKGARVASTAQPADGDPTDLPPDGRVSGTLSYRERAR